MSCCNSCHTQSPRLNNQLTLTLVKKDSVRIENTNNRFVYWGYHSDNNGDFLYMSDLNKSIHKYSFPSGDSLNTIRIPHQILEFGGFFVDDMDRIITKCKKKFTYHILDEKGLLIDSIRIVPEKYSPLPNVSLTNATFSDTRKIYFTGKSGGVYKDEKKGDRSVITKFNMSNREIVNLGDYPDLYYKNSYGGLHFQIVYNTINYMKKVIVLSFPASHEVYTFSIDDEKMHKINSGCSLIPNIDPLSRNRDWYAALAKQDYLEYYYMTPSYAEIYYDKFKDLYYRVIELPNVNFNYNNRETYYKDDAIVILDSEFNVIGYKKLSERVFTAISFITEEGIYFLKFSESYRDINFLRYSVEKIQ